MPELRAATAQLLGLLHSGLHLRARSEGRPFTAVEERDERKVIRRGRC